MTSAEQLQHAFQADFFRCYACHSIFTLREQREFMVGNLKGPCPICSANKYQEADSSNLHWYEWAHPRVIVFSLLRLLGRV